MSPRRRLWSSLALAIALVLPVSGPVMAANDPGDDHSLGERSAMAPTDVSDARDFPPGYEGYHTYAEMVRALRALEAAHPDIVRVSSIGRSEKGRKILVAKISDNVGRAESEPEILIDGLHHGKEHLSAEQALYMARMLANTYGRNERVTRLVDRREWWIIPMVNPDGGEWDIRDGRFHGWRKNRQPNGGDQAIGTDLNRNYGYRWGCCGGSSGSPGSLYYRGASPFSAPEVRAVRDFVRSRVVGGQQQIAVHVSLHAAGKLVMWPWAHSVKRVSEDMARDDHRVFVTLGRAMAKRNGYTPMQSSDLYLSDGDMIDWMYARHGIFSFTLELYPSGGAGKRPPDDDLIRRETERNRDALLYLAQQAGCPWRVIGKAARYCD